MKCKICKSANCYELDMCDDCFENWWFKDIIKRIIKPKQKKIIIALMLFILSACSSTGWQVKTDRGFLGPDVYELTNGDISVKYYNQQCCCIAKEVLIELKRRIEAGKVKPERLKNNRYKEMILKQICKQLQLEFSGKDKNKNQQNSN